MLLNTKSSVWTFYHLPDGIETETELGKFGFFSLQVKLQKACKCTSTSLILLFLQSPLLAWICSLLKLPFLPAPTNSFIHSFGHTVCWNRTIFSHFFMSSNLVPGHTYSEINDLPRAVSLQWLQWEPRMEIKISAL